MKQSVIRLALAEDHPVVRHGIAHIFDAYGNISVDILAENGRDLIEQITRANDKPNICMLDIEMKEMDGFQTAVAIKKMWPDMKILAFSSYRLDYYIIRMFLCGATAYVSKNASPAHIKAALETIYEGNTFYNELLTRQLCKDISTKRIKLPVITEKEMEVLKYSCSKLSFAEIALKMNTSVKSVEGYRDRLYKKLNINNRAELVIFAIQYGVVRLDIHPLTGSFPFTRTPPLNPGNFITY